MSSTTSEPVSLENSHLGEADTFNVRRLNDDWTLQCGSCSAPGSIIAVLSSLTPAGASSYTFTRSNDNAVSGTFHSTDATLTEPFTTGVSPMGLDWIYEELLQSPDAFTHSNLERAALTATVFELRGIAEPQRARNGALPGQPPSGQTTVQACMDMDDEFTQVDYPDFYFPEIHSWAKWQPDNVIASLYRVGGPLLQRESSMESLYEFKLTVDDTLTISTRHPEVEAAWHTSAERLKLHRDKGKDFKLVDVICFLQTDVILPELPIPAEEVAALKDCVYKVAEDAVERLQHPTFVLLRARSPVLQCELNTLTLCLRREKGDQSTVAIKHRLNPDIDVLIYGRISPVMTTETQTAVEISVTYMCDGELITPPHPYKIRENISELNAHGVYFCRRGLGDAGKILVLPEEATPLFFPPTRYTMMETQSAGEPETPNQDDHDSAIGDLSSEVFTSRSTSLSSSFYEYPTEYGRTYHVPQRGVFYPFPNDEKEKARLDLSHAMYLTMNDSRLHICPVVSPARVLDVGTGTGIWALGFADQCPEATVIGIDISPIQPTWTAPNCTFYLRDFQQDWGFPDPFDFIYARDLFCSLQSPVRLLRQAFENLRPGGWFEVQDFGLPKSDDGTIKLGSRYQDWTNLYRQAMQKVDRDPELAQKYGDMMGKVGFINVSTVTRKVPHNTWPKNKQLKTLGSMNRLNIHEGLEGFSLRPFCGILEMSETRVYAMLAEMRRELNDRKIHAYTPV
ncbi:uncharacterized protein PV07_02615 [Cladophialophora immunda]|uniref:Methyltransferase domain-containing protein n=1 Tax=Cladophialophora immunda TaxID=569365 RepID=A0A0D2D5I7_9EURO|nr:uncharacterized protein PV07_02615 [Cladophialophora immunda]KIW30924.1 hypothetical protein PV07_02615 [Cladophialophora immunda]